MSPCPHIPCLKSHGCGTEDKVEELAFGTRTTILGTSRSVGIVGHDPITADYYNIRIGLIIFTSKFNSCFGDLIFEFESEAWHAVSRFVVFCPCSFWYVLDNPVWINQNKLIYTAAQTASGLSKHRSGPEKMWLDRSDLLQSSCKDTV